MSKRIFLTGGSGFIGACIAKKLVERGFPTAVLLRPGKQPWRLTNFIDKLTMVKGDLASPESYKPALAAFRPDILIHLGWEGVGGKDRDNEIQIDNVINSMMLMRAALAAGADRIIGIGSQAEYGPCPARIHESTPTQPTTLYGTAKLATCQMGMKLAENKGVGFSWLRLFSVYGPADEPTWLIPYVINALLDGKRPSLTAAEQRWDYLHVDDVAEAVLAVVTANASGIFNLGSGQSIKVRDIVTQVRDMIASKAELGFGEVPYRPDQVMHLEADIAAISAATGWVPNIKLEEGLRETVNWFKASRTAARVV